VADTNAQEVNGFAMKGAELNDVTVTINNRPWRLVPSFSKSGPRDRDFTAVQTADGSTIVQFGDGVHGAKPPIGAEIKVRYRGGEGASGNTATVTLQRTATDPTADQALWVAIRNRAGSIRFEFGDRPRRRKP